MNGVADSGGIRGAAFGGSGELLDRIIDELRTIDQRGGIVRTLAIGNVILERFFGGDATVWRDRRRNKNNSIRRLAEREDCPFSKSTLNDAVAIYVASLEMPCVRTFGHIEASHVAAVLSLPPPGRVPMLEAAEHDKLSVRDLRRRVASQRRAHGEKRGRPAQSGEQRALELVRNGTAEIRRGAVLISTNSALDSDSRVECLRLAKDLSALSVALEEAGNG